jgi:uncharacterized protein
MILSLRRALLASLVLTLLAGSGAAADAPAVRDGAGFFSAAAVKKTNEDLGALKDEFGTELRIETVKSVPDNRVDEVKKMNAAQRNQFFLSWTQERARAEKLHGVYVLICKTPGHLQVDMDNETQKKAFTSEDRKAMRDALMAAFKDTQFDQGLGAAVKVYGERLNKNLPPTQRRVVRQAVKDYAGLFSAAAVQKANAMLQDLPRSPGKEVAIETFPTPPNPQKLEGMSAAQRSKYFKDWIKERAERNNLQGVLVLITKQPGHLQIDVRGKTARDLIPAADYDKLQSELRSRLASHAFDQGLAGTVEFLSMKLGPRKLASSQTVSVPPAGAARVKAAEVLPGSKANAAVPAAPKAADATSAKADVNSPANQGKEAVAAAGTPPKKDSYDLNRVKEKAQEIGETRIETWKWVVGIIVGLLALFILTRILRALFGGRRQAPAAMAPAPRPTMPQVPPGYPPATPGYPASGPSYPASAPPPRPAAPAPGYAPVPQAAYPPAAPQMPAQPTGGGGGFVKSVLGGAVGAAAGSLLYDKLHGRGGAAPTGPAYPQPTTPYRQAPQQPANTASDDAYNRGSDFDASGQSATAANDGGGDFDTTPPANADLGGGGEFGTPQTADLGGGGDFGSEQTAESGGGGDFGSEQTAESGGGGDFGSAQTADMSGGGDFGSEPPTPPDQYAQDDAGGDFGASGSSDSPAVADQGGGDFG